MDENKIDHNNEKIGIFSSLGRVAAIFFICFSLFLIISTIMLIFLTKPSKEIKVPNVTGRKFVDVYNSLVRKGIRPDVAFKDVFDIDDGLILKQYPEKDTIIPSDTKLKLTVSRSSFNIDVPNLIGTELPIARNKLKNLQYHGRSVSLGTGVISYIPSDKSADNIIIDQSPKSGEKVTPDRKINLLVSTGTLQTDRRMPGVVGQSIDLCYDLLMAKGLTVVEEIVETWDINKSGTVIGQKPYKGKYVRESDRAVLKVYWYPLKDHPYRAYEKVEYVIPQNQKEGLYEALIEDNMSKRIRFSAKMKPGSKISFIFHRVGNARVVFMKDKKQIRVMGINVE